MKNKHKVILTILDGWGKEIDKNRSAIAQAATPFVDSMYVQYPNAVLKTFGTDVGLPEGQMGNSEVGHLNIGAGRIVYQELQRINKAIESGELEQNQNLINCMEHCKTNNTTLHLMGLVSDGGVHAHVNHLKALITYAENFGLEKVFIHAFMDGRDTAPTNGKKYLHDLQTFIADKHARIATVIGRYYAMDRDERWERTALAYDLITKGKGEKSTNLLDSIQRSYDNGITDEFLKPIFVEEAEAKNQTIKENDAVLCFNFRTDRGRQISRALTQEALADFGMRPISVHYTTMTSYSDDFEGINILFEKNTLKNTIGEILSTHNLPQLRMAETEKYPHVTFFFNGGREKPFSLEDRIMVNSPKVATYDLQPEMSAEPLTDRLLEAIETNEHDFICINYANPDMVGHTGDMKAAMAACSFVDSCLEKVVKNAKRNDYELVVIADHGNADIMRNLDGSLHTAHTTNLVPIFVVSNRFNKVSDGILADVAPTVLKMMGIEQPKEMNGKAMI